MYGSGEGQKGSRHEQQWVGSRSRTGKPSKRFKAALGFGRGKARGARKSNPETGGSLKQRARELVASCPKNDSERQLQALATAWLANKGAA